MTKIGATIIKRIISILVITKFDVGIVVTACTRIRPLAFSNKKRCVGICGLHGSYFHGIFPTIQKCKDDIKRVFLMAAHGAKRHI